MSSICRQLETLEYLTLKNLPDLRKMTKMGAYCSFSRLKQLEIVGCPKLKVVIPLMSPQKQHQNCIPFLEQIAVRDCVDSSSSSNAASSAFSLPNLRDLRLKDLPKLGCVHSTGLQLSTSLESIKIRNCPELEQIFSSPTSGTSPIVALPNLRVLHLENLPKLSSFFRGLLFCPCLSFSNPSFWSYFKEDETQRMKKLPGSNCLICNTSQSFLASIPTMSENSEWWEPIRKDYPADACFLSELILEARQPSPTAPVAQVLTNPRMFDHDDDDKTKWGKTLSLSLSSG